MKIHYSDELRRIKDNITEYITRNRDSLATENGVRITAEQYKELTVDGPLEGTYRFSDLSYGERIGANWDIAAAMARVSKLAQLFYLSGYLDALALELITGHLRDFLAQGYVSTNWYHNDLGVPAIMNNIMILAEDYLPSDVRDGLIAYIGNGSLRVHPEIIEVKNAYHSGANLTNYCNVSLHHGLYTHDTDEIIKAVKATEAETYGGREGMQSDGSFFQHGRRLYSLGYGLGYIADITRILYYIKGTSFDFSKEGKENLLKHVLDGVRYMIGARGYDWGASGRGYTRTNSLQSAVLIPSLELLAKMPDMPRADELSRLIEDIKAGRQPVKGVKYFDVARLLTLHTDNLYVSFKGAGPGIRTSEICTFENYMGVNLSYGTSTCVMREGREYFNISGIWDYSAIPGTTAREEDDATIIAYPDFTKYEVDTEDYGGAQLGDVGVCFIGGENYGVRAVKSAIATPECMIILGAGITEREGKPVRTTVEQSISMGQISIDSQGMEVRHGGILYKNLDKNSPFVAFVEHREFETERNGRRIAPYHVEGDVFNVRIDHRVEGAAYAYLITECELAESVSGVEVIENTEARQAVRLPDGRVVAVFHEAGELILGEGVIKGQRSEIVIQ